MRIELCCVTADSTVMCYTVRSMLQHLNDKPNTFYPLLEAVKYPSASLPFS